MWQVYYDDNCTLPSYFVFFCFSRFNQIGADAVRCTDKLIQENPALFFCGVQV